MFRKTNLKSDTSELLLILVFVSGIAGCYPEIGKDKSQLPGTSKTILIPDPGLSGNIHVGASQSTMDLLACIKCHNGLKINTKKRILTGTHKDLIFDHPGFDSETRWCYYCHSSTNLDSLKFETGRLTGYRKSYELCVQCHVTKYAEWEVGIHGRRIGEWNGEKEYLSCITCHDAHSPRFKPIESMKPPLKPAKFSKTSR